MANGRWAAIGASARGTAHARTGLPNQDAWAQEESADGGTLISVADGHGGGAYFRSDVGAALATAAGIAAMRKDVGPDVPARIVEEWRRAVDEHLAGSPLEDGGEPSRTPYGCTVLAVAALADAVHVWQLGDGDILCVDAEGNTRRPLARDPRLVANETTSLCMEEAVREFRCGQIALEGGEPALIAVATDGYANSFETDDDFLQIGRDYWEMFRSGGPEAVAEQLGGILEDTSRHGSGDDITLVLAYRAGAEELPKASRMRRAWRRALRFVTL